MSVGEPVKERCTSFKKQVKAGKSDLSYLFWHSLTTLFSPDSLAVHRWLLGRRVGRKGLAISSFLVFLQIVRLDENACRFPRRFPSGFFSWSVDRYLNGDGRWTRENLKWAVHCCLGDLHRQVRDWYRKRLTLRKHKIYSTLDISNDHGRSGRANQLDTFQYLTEKRNLRCPCRERTMAYCSFLFLFDSPMSFRILFF